MRTFFLTFMPGFHRGRYRSWSLTHTEPNSELEVLDYRPRKPRSPPYAPFHATTSFFSLTELRPNSRVRELAHTRRQVFVLELILRLNTLLVISRTRLPECVLIPSVRFPSALSSPLTDRLLAISVTMIGEYCRGLGVYAVHRGFWRERAGAEGRAHCSAGRAGRPRVGSVQGCT
jgi:hypothetical protein